MDFKNLASKIIDDVSGIKTSDTSKNIEENDILEGLDLDFEETESKDISEDFDLDIEEIEPEEKVEQLFDGYLGEKNFAPNPLEYGPNAMYRQNGTVYRKSVDNLWEVYLQDGAQGPKGSAGGSGVGVQEVQKISTEISRTIVTSAISSISAIGDKKIYVDNYGAIGDGIIDDYSSIQLAISAVPNGGTLCFGNGKNYRIAQRIVIDKSIIIEGNNSSIVSNSATILFKNERSRYGAKNYFNVSAGDYSFVSPTVSFQVGDVVRLTSDDQRPNTNGDYLLGQLVYIVSASGTTYYIEHPILESFTVDRIYINNKSTLIVNNLNFDVRETIRQPDENIYHVNVADYYHTEFNSCSISGGDGSGVGFHIQSYIGRMNSCSVTDIKDIPYNSTSADVILGYGYNMIGDDLVLNNCYGYNCKHIIDSSDRYAITRNLKVVGGYYCTPNSRYNETYTIAGVAGVAACQYSVGVHANVKNFIVDGVYIDCVNDLVGARNGNLIMTNCYLMCRSYLAGYANVIRVGEHVLENINISNCVVDVDPSASRSLDKLKFFISLINCLDGSKNVSINNVTMNGCCLGTAFYDQTESCLENVTFSNIKGIVPGGFTVLNLTSASYLKNLSINNCNLTLDNTKTVSKPFVYLSTSNVSGVNIFNNVVDFRNSTSSDKTINIDNSKVENINIKGNKIDSGFIAFEYKPYSNILPDNLNIQDNDITYFHGTPSSAFIPGVNLVISTYNEKTWKVVNNNITLINTSAASNCNPIRITTSGDVQLLNNKLNRDWYFATYPNIIPTGNVNVSGTLSWKGGTKIDTKGEMTKSTSATTGTFYVGERIYNSALTSAGPLGWVCVTSGTPGTWVNLNI